MKRARITGLIAVACVAASLLAGAPAYAAGGAVQAKASLHLSGVFSVQHQPVTVPGRAFTVTGVVRPYVPGQGVLLKAYVNGRMFKMVKLGLKPSAHHVYGGFTWKLVSPAAGPVSIAVVHARNAAMLGFIARSKLSALDERVSFGSTGRFVELIQQRLSALHIYIPQTGVYDAGTGLAVDAYHRLLRWGTSQSLGPATVNALLNGTGAFPLRFPKQGRHAEGNLGLQLLALADGSHVYWIFPISSGKPSTPTVLGSWKIYRRVPGYLPDGMYYSSFFTGGYAIHGYNPAPDYPASHGCMRLPIRDAIAAFNWLAMGDWVDTYY